MVPSFVKPEIKIETKQLAAPSTAYKLNMNNYSCYLCNRIFIRQKNRVYQEPFVATISNVAESKLVCPMCIDHGLVIKCQTVKEFNKGVKHEKG